MLHCPRIIEISVRIYRLFIFAYPAAFRRQFSGEMTEVFRAMAISEWQRRKVLGLAHVWLSVIWDFIRSLVREHAASLRKNLVAAWGRPSWTGSGSASSGIGTPTLRRTLISLGIGFAVANLVLWFVTPAIRHAVDVSAGRIDDPGRPYIVNGVQELLVYFDPWLARYVFPIVFTIGFAAIPYLAIRYRNGSAGRDSTKRLVAACSLLITLEAVWLYLIFVGVWCRGPDWNFYWPGDSWDAARVVAIHRVNLSEYFWTGLFNKPTQGMAWLIRELPGIVLLAGYFALGFLLVMRMRRNDNGMWRLATVTFLLQCGLFIPIKMFAKATCDLMYVVALPELLINV